MAFPGVLSLTTRLGVALTLVFTLGGVAVGLAALAYGRTAAQQSYDRLLTGAARQIAGSVSLRDGAVVADLPVSAFELLSLAPRDRIVYAVYDRDGQLVTGYDALAPRPGAEFFNASFTGAPVRVAQSVRAFSERGYSGEVVVLVGQTLEARRQLAAQITRNALLTAGVIGLVMSALAVFATQSALRPLWKIRRNLAGRAANDLTPLDVAVPREIEGLVLALNRFMARLDRQMTGMRTLIADASHQLRTPVAGLRAQAELAQEETDPERLRAILARIHRRSRGLGHLTDQLLSHALIIHRGEAEPLEPLDLRTVAIRAMDEIDIALLERPHLPELDLPEDPVWCRGDALSLAEATKNLLWNALRHGAEPVTLSVRADVMDVRLAVRDAGPGLPEAHWGDAGRRYARDSGVSPESAGLGLAIVQAVATAHGGRLVFAHAAGGFEAALALPRIRKPAS